ncbi:conserved Plasmodium protein, unknown function [Plasmodium malariae]|uniref:Uncharacterized protein n=1 Tax=Plasmodium malariae TaxID=5858 RepID=A0A1A8X1M2_PLAMA|nr:conserved Plasmodium protein, unknown function [Plasmodium malariae]
MLLLDKYIVSTLCSLPIAASLTQIFYLTSKTINPIAWAITTYVLVVLRNHVETDYNHILNKIPTSINEFL